MSTITETAIAVAISLAAVTAGLAFYKGQIRAEVLSDIQGKMNAIEAKLKEDNKISVEAIVKDHNEKLGRYHEERDKVLSHYAPRVAKECDRGRISTCVTVLEEQDDALLQLRKKHLPPEGAVAGGS